MMRECLLQVVYWTRDWHAQHETALPWWIRERSQDNRHVLDVALLKAKIETGMYRKPVTEHAKEALQPEVRAVVIAAWQRGGLLPVQRLNSWCHGIKVRFS